MAKVSNEKGSPTTADPKSGLAIGARAGTVVAEVVEVVDGDVVDVGELLLLLLLLVEGVDGAAVVVAKDVVVVAVSGGPPSSKMHAYQLGGIGGVHSPASEAG